MLLPKLPPGNFAFIRLSILIILLSNRAAAQVDTNYNVYFILRGNISSIYDTRIAVRGNLSPELSMSFDDESKNNHYWISHGTLFHYSPRSLKKLKDDDLGFAKMAEIRVDRCQIKINKAKASQIGVFGKIDWLEVIHSSVGILTIDNIHGNYGLFFHSFDNNLRRLSVSNSTLKTGFFTGIFSKIDTLEFEGDTIEEGFSLRRFGQPKMLHLANLNFKNGALVDLTKLSMDRNELVGLDIFDDVDIARLKLDYTYFNLFLPATISTSKKEEVYKAMIENQRNAGYLEGLKKADIEFQRFENDNGGPWGKFKNWLLPWWNNYGYEKEKIFQIAAWAFLGVFLINLCMLIPLIKNGYPLTEFIEAVEKLERKNIFLKILLYPLYCIFFTGIVFWGLKIDLDKVKISSGFAIWIFTQYIIGLVLLAFIANVVIGK
jgi:hypothetical protein